MKVSSLTEEGDPSGDLMDRL